VKATTAARLAIIAIGGLMLLGAAPASAAAPPSIESVSATNITAHDATLSAQINPNGLVTTYQFHLVYGCPLFGNEVCPTICPVPPGTCGGRFEVPLPSGEIPASFETQAVSVDLNAVGITLDPAERYGYTIEATNSAGPPAKGPDQTFTALAEAPGGELPEAPVTEACSGPINGSGVQLCGTLNPGSSAKVGYYFEVREGSSCVGGTHFGDLAEVEGQNVPVSTQVHSLAPYTEYTVCLVATNSAGETRGQGLVFMTSGPPPSAAEPPTILSQSASNVTTTDVTLEAEIDPNGRDTVYELQIDTTGNFSFYQTSSCALNVPGVGCTTEVVPGDPLAPGLVQPPEYTLPASDEPQQVSLNMAGIGTVLQPGTTYHYRAIAANGEQIVEGPDQTFTTPSPDVTPPGQPPVGFTAPVSLPAVNPAPSVSHPRRGKHRRHRHRRHDGSARSTRTVRH
jgi:hypothetical protein